MKKSRSAHSSSQLLPLLYLKRFLIAPNQPFLEYRRIGSDSQLWTKHGCSIGRSGTLFQLPHLDALTSGCKTYLNKKAQYFVGVVCGPCVWVIQGEFRCWGSPSSSSVCVCVWRWAIVCCLPSHRICPVKPSREPRGGKRVSPPPPQKNTKQADLLWQSKLEAKDV